MKRFSVKDGLGIRYLQKAGLNICIVTGGKEDVIKKRFGIDEDQAFTLEEIGKEFNVTRERIRQIELKALKKLKKIKKSPVLNYLGNAKY